MRGKERNLSHLPPAEPSGSSWPLRLGMEIHWVTNIDMCLISVDGKTVLCMCVKGEGGTNRPHA